MDCTFCHREIEGELYQILNKEYTDVRYCGGAFYDLSSHDYIQSLQTRMQQTIALTGANIFRFAVSPNPHDVGLIIDTPEVMFPALDEVSQLCQALKKKWLWNYHGLDAETSAAIGLTPDNYERYINFHRAYLTRYRDDPSNWGFEAYNEMGDYWGDQASVRQIMETLLLMRDAVAPSKHVIVSCGNGKYAQIDQDYIDKPLPYERVYYGIWHYFRSMAHDWYHQPFIDGDYETGKSRLRSHMINYQNLRAAEDAGLRVFCPEFGFGIFQGWTDPVPAAQAWFENWRELGVDGYTIWQIWVALTQYGIFKDWDWAELSDYGLEMAADISQRPLEGTLETKHNILNLCAICWRDHMRRV